LTTVPILYDADCGFCRASLGLVLAWDRRRRLRPVALQSVEAKHLLAEMPEERRMASWHLVTEGGEVHSAGAAFPPLLRELRGGRLLAGVMRRFPRATEGAYRVVAGSRSTLGRLLPERAKRRADRLIEHRSHCAVAAAARACPCRTPESR
jgi:predicted DCC family thiol-disulfide oxidoreductase YuxK